MIAGSIDMGMPKIPHTSSRQVRVRISMSMVREAFVTSVQWTPPLTPPVMFHRTHESVLPNSRSPASARSRAPSTLSRIHLILEPEKYGDSPRPQICRKRSGPSSPPSSFTISAVRMSCQTIAL